MQEALKPAFLDDILFLIFKLVPFVKRQQISQVNKSWHQTYHDPKFLLGAEHALLKMYREGASSKSARRLLQETLVTKTEVISKSKDNSLWDSILYMLMAYINDIEPERLSNAQEALQKQISEITETKNVVENLRLGKSPRYDLNLASALQKSLSVTQYAAGDGKFKNSNRKFFLQWCNTKSALFINFNGGNLSQENLTDKNFFGSSFIETSFCGAMVEGTRFGGANLMRADLSDVKGRPIFDCHTILIDAKMPPEIKILAEKAGAICTLKDVEARIKENPSDFPPGGMEEFVKTQKRVSGIGRGPSMYTQSSKQDVNSKTPLINNKSIENDGSCGCTIS